MFNGQSAWFSASVSRKIKQQWVDHGGGEKSFEEAQFIFSQDAEAPDTLRVFDSDAYLEEHLAVFHPSYIQECVKQGTKNEVTLGKYFFPPADVQAIAREQIQYQWDMDGYTLSDNTSNSGSRDEKVNLSSQQYRAWLDCTDVQAGLALCWWQSPSQFTASVQRVTCVVWFKLYIFQSDDEEPTRPVSEQNKEDMFWEPPTSVGHGSKESGDKGLSENRNFANSPRQRIREVKDKTVSSVPKYHSTSVVSKGGAYQSMQKELKVELRRISLQKSPRKVVESKTVDSQDEDKRIENAKLCKTRDTPGRKRMHDLSNKTEKSESDNDFSSDEEMKGDYRKKASRQTNGSFVLRHKGEECAEILRLENLAKVTGDLQDFIVGKNGCELVRIS